MAFSVTVVLNQEQGTLQWNSGWIPGVEAKNHLYLFIHLFVPFTSQIRDTSSRLSAESTV